MSKDRGIVFEAEVSRAVSPGTTTLYDRSRYGNNGTWTAGAYTRLESGLWVPVFNGATSRVSIPTAMSLSALPTFSVAIWFNQDIQGLEGLVSKDDGGANREWAFNITGTNGRLTVWLLSAGGGGNLNAQGTTDASDTNWHFGVMTWNGVNAAGNILLYADGVLEALTTDVKNAGGYVPFDGVAPVEIGRYVGNNTYCFDGKLALSRIYNYALSAGQILKHFEAERSLFGV